MATETWVCKNCEKTFKVGKWLCDDGSSNHVVESVRYYMSDAPTVKDAHGHIDKRSGTLVMNIPPEKRTTGPDGNERVIPGGAVQFIRGLYETSNPEEQYWLNIKKDRGGLCSEAQWQAAYLNAEEKMAIKEMQLAAREQRIEQENNRLLELTQRKGA